MANLEITTVGAMVHSIAREIERAVKRDDIETLRVLLRDKPECVYFSYGDEPQNLLEYLTNNYPKDRHNLRPLCQMMEVVVEAAARVDAKPKTTPFHRICSFGGEHEVPLLQHMLDHPKLSGDYMAENSTGETPVYLAAINNRQAMLRVLLDHGADLANYIIEWDETRYDYYLKHNGRFYRKPKLLYQDTVCMIIECGAIKLDNTLLGGAMRAGHPLVVKHILESPHMALDNGDCLSYVCCDLEMGDHNYTIGNAACVELLMSQQTLYVPPLHKYRIISSCLTCAVTNLYTTIRLEQVRRHMGWSRRFLQETSEQNKQEPLERNKRPWILERARAVIITLQYRIGLPCEIVFMILANVKCCRDQAAT